MTTNETIQTVQAEASTAIEELSDFELEAFAGSASVGVFSTLAIRK